MCHNGIVDGVIYPLYHAGQKQICAADGAALKGSVVGVHIYTNTVHTMRTGLFDCAISHLSTDAKDNIRATPHLKICQVCPYRLV